MGNAQMIPKHVWMQQWEDAFCPFKKDIIVILKSFSVINMYCCHGWRLFIMEKKTIIMLVSIKLDVVVEKNVISSKVALN